MAEVCRTGKQSSLLAHSRSVQAMHLIVDVQLCSSDLQETLLDTSLLYHMFKAGLCSAGQRALQCWGKGFVLRRFSQ